MLAELSLKTSIDYRIWSKQNLPLNFETENSESKPNDSSSNSNLQFAGSELLRQLYMRDKENNIHNDNDDYNSERALLLEQNYGIYTTEATQNYSPNRKAEGDSGNGINGKTSIRSIQSIQITRSLKSRAQALKRNAEILRVLAKQKRQDTELVKSLITTEAEQLAAALDKKDISSDS
ncbi:hypothetical protein PMKS-003056 [Pichia membranifaciens]|uniref:Uncharacterized protein n=1 Tax=Pichia membranifaciens TaxID=4926 RepID=A0A1Q2YJ55_9ASCO|nr:hypothetical protein PMKS-003056 [Pichia membranifaciens]